MRKIKETLQDTVIYSDETQGSFHLIALDCEKCSGDSPRFSCWVASHPQGSPLVTLELHEFMYAIGDGSTFLFQFQFPLNLTQARGISKLGAAAVWSPIRPNRWCRLHAIALDKNWTAIGKPCLDFHKELFTWEYRLYLCRDTETLLVPLLDAAPDDSLDDKRSWYLLDATLQSRERLFEAKPCIPPHHSKCKIGPDGRLPRALAKLKESPQKLRLNRLSHQLGNEAPLMRSGLPFCVENLAAPRNTDKQAAFSILRMPVFGANFGVRSRMDQPLGGEEVSAGCMGSADNGAMSVLDNETRRVRQGNDAKEVTALVNKKATIKSNLAEVSKSCHSIYGPAVKDVYCRRRKDGSDHFCRGVIGADLKCQTCKTGYKVEDLICKKRLLDDADFLQVCKKMRSVELPPKHHVLIRGGECYSIQDLSAGFDSDIEDAAVLTKVPDDCRLSSNRSLALAFPVEVVYILGNRGRLQAVKSPYDVLHPAPNSRGLWLLPKGHYILCEKFRIPRGLMHMNEVVHSTVSESLTRELKRQRIKMVWPDIQRPEGEADAVAVNMPADWLYARLVGPWEEAMMRRIKAAKEFQIFLESFSQPKDAMRVDDCHDYQFDKPLVDLDFVVLSFQGKDFCSLPQLHSFGTPLRSVCSCKAESKVTLLKNASEEERCIIGSRSFQGSYSTLCPSCLARRVTKALKKKWTL